MILVCAWCQETPKNQGPVSHIICEECLKRELATLNQGDGDGEVQD